MVGVWTCSQVVVSGGCRLQVWGKQLMLGGHAATTSGECQTGSRGRGTAKWLEMSKWVSLGSRDVTGAGIRHTHGGFVMATQWVHNKACGGHVVGAGR